MRSCHNNPRTRLSTQKRKDCHPLTVSF